MTQRSPDHRPPVFRAGGFTLLELSALLALTSVLIFLLLYKASDLSLQRSNISSTESLRNADEQLRRHAAWHGRLPCPDSTGDGVENCGTGDTKGGLPYRTLGLSALGYEAGAMALSYGVYRNAAVEADLAQLDERFKPTNADGTVYDLGNRNSLDFCQALEHGIEQSASTDQLYLQRPDGSRSAMAYMLASPGTRDADGANGLADGPNGSSSTGFNSHETAIAPDYDDLTQGRGFAELYNLMRCEVTMRSVHLAANNIALEEEVIAFAESNKDSADEGVFMNAVGTAISVWGLAQTAAEIGGASEVLATSSGLLAGATAGCAVPPFATCALVPVYAGAVASATTGLNLAIAATALAATATGLQVSSTVMYALVANKAGVPDTVSPATGVDQGMVDEQFADYQDLNAIAQTAEAQYANALAAYTAGEKSAADAADASLRSALDNMSGGDPNRLRDEIYGFPRQEDIDPENPPDENDVILGAMPAIDAWRRAEFDVKRFDGIELRDENDNLVDLEAAADSAQSNAEDEISEARALTTAGPVRDALDDYVDAYDVERQAWYELEVLRADAEGKRQTADSAYDQYGALDCAMDGQDYDSSTNSCTAGAPGSSGANMGVELLCNPVNTDTYDADACAALQATPQVGDLIEFFTGMRPLVNQLDASGTVL